MIAAGREFRRLGLGNMGEAVFSCASFAHGRMYIRGERHLFAFGERAPAP